MVEMERSKCDTLALPSGRSPKAVFSPAQEGRAFAMDSWQVAGKGG